MYLIKKENMKITFDEETFSDLQIDKEELARPQSTDIKNCKVAFCVAGFENFVSTDGTLKLIGVMENVDLWCDDGSALYITKNGKSHLVVEAIFSESYDEFIE